MKWQRNNADRCRYIQRSERELNSIEQTLLPICACDRSMYIQRSMLPEYVIGHCPDRETSFPGLGLALGIATESPEAVLLTAEDLK